MFWFGVWLKQNECEFEMSTLPAKFKGWTIVQSWRAWYSNKNLEYASEQQNVFTYYLSRRKDGNFLMHQTQL